MMLSRGSVVSRRLRRAAACLLAGYLLAGCTTSARTEGAGPSPTGPATSSAAVSPTPSRVAGVATDYVALQRQLKKELSSGDPGLTAVRSVLVSVDGQTVVQHYQDRTPKDYAHVWSVTKSVLSSLVGIAVDEGRLALDTTLPELLPQHTSVMTEQEKTITLRQLLTMTSGIAGDDGAMNPSSDDAAGQILTYGTTNDPGVAFEYSNGGAHLVAAVLREAVDRPILEYAREKLFDPLGINTRPAWQGWDTGSRQSGFAKPGFAWATDASGLQVGGMGLKLTAPDLLKIGELFVNGGRWQGRQIVSESWVQESTSPQLTPEQAEAEGQYGYLWWTGDVNGHAGFVASGSYSQRIFGFPALRLVVVVTAAADESSPDTLHLTLDPILQKVVFGPLTR